MGSGAGSHWRGTQMKLGPAVVFAPDLDAALDFYGAKLGLTLLQRSANQLIFDAGGAGLHVFPCQDPAPDLRHGAQAASVLTFEVERLEDEMARLSGLGVAFLHETPGRNELAGVIYAAFIAPGGNVHELVERT